MRLSHLHRDGQAPETLTRGKHEFAGRDAGERALIGHVLAILAARDSG